MKFAYLFAAIALIAPLLSSCRTTTPPPVVSSFEPRRFAGEWHEIARLPNRFERDLVAAKAIYTARPNNSLHVRNEGLKENGERTSIEGTATLTGQIGKLEVKFNPFPANLFAGDYWILRVNNSYTRAVVGSPDKDYLWFLSKNPTDQKADIQADVNFAKSLGFNVAELYYNPSRIK